LISPQNESQQPKGTMNANQKHWNQNHQRLRLALASGNHQKAIDLFLSQHAMLHSHLNEAMRIKEKLLR